MNFLQLAQRLRQEAVGPGSSAQPNAVTGQVGQLKQFVDWVNDAWVDIQNLHTNWRWMRRECYVETSDGDGSYEPTDFTDVKNAAGIEATDFGYWWLLDEDDRRLWTIYQTTQDDEGDLIVIDFDDWRYLYDRGTGASQEGRPLHVTMAPDNAVKLGPKPDGVYRVRGWYQKAATRMAADDDEPDMPTQFHLAIVWRALMYYGEDRSAPDRYAAGANHFGLILDQLRKNQLPPVRLPAPLC